MVGQDNLKDKLNNYTASTFPHSVLLLGPVGAGHRDVCHYIANKFNFFEVDISEMISQEFINQMYLGTNPTLYTIDINKISDKEQNILLKIFEEPNGFTYLVLYGESTYNILETIVNRSYVLQMDLYKPEYLETLITSRDKDYILSLCSTPGQIETANHTNLVELKSLCKNIIERIGKASIGNALTISNKINFTDEYNKYDLYLFTKVLGHEMLSVGKYNLYPYLVNMNKNIGFMNDKKRYFDHFILEMWGASQNGH